jgi:hypothetical protein
MLKGEEQQLIKRQYLSLTVLVVIAGFIGGAVYSQVFMDRPAFAQSAQNVVKAKQFQLVDGDGNVRAIIGMSPKGHPVLGFTDENGKDRIFLGLTSMEGETWPILKLRDADEQLRISISGGSGRPRVSVLDQRSNSRAILGCADIKAADSVEQLPESSLVLLSEDGKLTWSAP